MLRIIGYARESTQRQALFGYNLEGQKEAIARYCKYSFDKEEYTLEILSDAKSGRSIKRESLNIIFEKVKNKEVDIIVFHDLNRLGRDIIDLINMINFFREHKVKVISIMEQFNLNTAIGRRFFYMTAVSSQCESEDISERTIRGIRAGFEAGKYVYGLIPYGFIRNKDKVLLVDKESTKAQEIKEIFELVSYGHHSHVEIAAMVNAKYNTKYWTEMNIAAAMKHHIYYGRLIYRDLDIRDFCEAIISEELFNEANKTRTFKYIYSQRKFMFSRLVRCKNCNKIMRNESAYSQTGKLYKYYFCKKCRMRIREDEILKKLEGEILDIVREYKRSCSKAYLNKNKELSETKSKFDTAIKMSDTDMVDPSSFKRLIKRLTIKIDKCQKYLDSFDNESINIHDENNYDYIREAIIQYVKYIKIKKIGKKISFEIIYKEDKK